METLLAYEVWLRLSAFLGLLALFLSWEGLAPKRERERTRRERWMSNSGIIIIDSIALRLVFPTAAIGAALWAAEVQFGLLYLIPNLPAWLHVLVAILILDFAIWLQHLSFHHVPWLWRLHRMHHSDVDVDVTTAVRFHPLEMLLSMLIKMGVVVIFGAPAVAVLLFEVLLNGTSLFNHSNIRLPQKADDVLRWFLVTPDMHRIHHSWHKEETNSNFGFNLPWWDKLFKTYRSDPKDGHRGMVLGLHEFREPARNRLHALLLQPLSNTAPSSRSEIAAVKGSDTEKMKANSKENS
ncbi:fatty acid hydroxylase [Aliidiomarina shirensis]|uniref:Fatty acid hydroxylase n=1 Tax=Aliidiomarina shirensis TaxID=1048642 RepID=A0A432WQH0_9GAMM|nr:sterol desaturase family protein [Aliidiomarina shirensis]RUO36008.1 fatty acid hydroxylase [Aliidiomarina shirensis]